jgi:hypothetical protein
MRHNNSHSWRAIAIGGAFLVVFACATFSYGPESTANPPNTGMADPAALINAFDKFMAKGSGGQALVLSLSNLRGLSSESQNAGGRVEIDLANDVVTSKLTGLPSDVQYDLWLIDNRPSPNHTTFAGLAEPGDVLQKVGPYGLDSEGHSLTVSRGPAAFNNFFPDRAVVSRSGQSPVNSFVLTGPSTLFDRLRRRQVRFTDDPGAVLGFDPFSSTRAASFAKLVAQGRQLFLKEKFNGNGRTCGTCHVETNNFTIDPDLIATLPPTDPLFVAETNPALATLENRDLMHRFGLILVNADGFDKKSRVPSGTKCASPR